MEQKVMEILCGICGAEPGELSPQVRLFDEGLLDSFGVIQLLMELEAAFGVTLAMEELDRDQLSTPEAIALLVEEAKR